MAKFNGTVDQIENNTNKKDTFDKENASQTAYLSEVGVRDAVWQVEAELGNYVQKNGNTVMTGNQSMGGYGLYYVDHITMTNDPQSDNDVGRRSYNDARYLKASDKVTAISSSSTNAQIPSALAVYNSVNGCLKSSQKVTSISASSTDNQIPSAKCVYDAISAGGTREKWVEIDTESGTSEAKNKITIDFTTGGTKTSYRDIVIAINVPPPPVNLSYCQAKVTLKGGGIFYANAETAIQATATKTALCYFKFNVDDGMVNFACYTRANIGRSYAQIGDNVNPVVAGGTAGCFGMSLNYNDPTDYEISAIELIPTNNQSSFAIGTNYRVWGKE